MPRSIFRRSLRVEGLESRELLSQGGPSAQQEYMLYLLNQARTNPAEMAQRVTSNLDANVQATLQYYNVNLDQVKGAISGATAQPPLAWNDQLAQAAAGHSQDMSNNGFQSHTGSDGSSSGQRMQAAGYGQQSSSGENAFAYSSGVDEAMEAFLIDWGVSSNGHRNNILQPGTSGDDAYRDVGIGLVDSTRPNFGPLVVTQDFGAQQGEKAQLLGVAFNDPNHTNGLTPGQGQGGVTVTATNLSTGQSSSTQTWDSGGYQMPLGPGQYRVTATDNGQVVKSQNVTIGNTNVEVDYNLSNSWQGGSPAPVVVVPSVTTPPKPTTNNSSSSTPISNNNVSFSGNVSQPVQVAMPTDGSWQNSWSQWRANKTNF